MTTERKFELSIIIVTYNNERYLDKLLKELNSGPLNWQIIIIDNNSRNPKTKKILSKYKKEPNFSIIFNQENIGFARAVNQGEKLAKGKYLLLLNPDIIINPSQIKRLLQFTEKNFGVVAPTLVLPNGKRQSSVYHLPSLTGAIKEFVIGVKNSYSPYVPRSKRPLQVEMAVGACLLIPHKLFKSLGGLNPKYFLYFEDVDFCQRLKHHNIPIWYLPEVKVKHYLGESGRKSKTQLLLEKSASLYFGKTKKRILDIIIRFGHFLPALFLSLILAYFKTQIAIRTARFGADQEYLAWQAVGAWSKKKLFFTGLPGSIGGFFIAPYYSYLNTLFFILANFNPQAIFLTTFFSYFLTLTATYYLSFLVLKSRSLSYLMMFIFSLSAYSLGLWPVDWLFLSGVLFLTSFWFLLEKKYDNSLIFLALSFLIGVSAHPSYLTIIPFVLLLTLLLFPKTKRKIKITSVFIFTVSFLPLLLFDLKHRFYNLKGILAIFKDQQNRYDYTPTSHLKFFFLNLSRDYLDRFYLSKTFNNVFFPLLSGVSWSYFYFQKRKKGIFYLLGVSFAFMLLLAVSLILQKTVDYYLLYPGLLLFFLSWLAILDLINNLVKPIRILLILSLGSVLFYFSFLSLNKINPFSWYYQRKAIHFITSHFDLKCTKLAIITNPGYQKGFYYLFSHYPKGQSKPTLCPRWVNLVFVSNWYQPGTKIKEIGGYKIFWK